MLDKLLYGMNGLPHKGAARHAMLYRAAYDAVLSLVGRGGPMCLFGRSAGRRRSRNDCECDERRDL